jgi:ATP-dependent Lhr-like helicase
MLISRRVNERWLFAHLRTVIVDEVHSFAASDRGWPSPRSSPTVRSAAKNAVGPNGPSPNRPTA